jgi:hypothetical protein
VSKNFGFPSITLYYLFDKDFLTPDYQNKGRLQRVFTPDLVKELRERAINLQAMFNRMCGAEFRKLDLEFAEANNQQKSIRQDIKKAASHSSKHSCTLKLLSFHSPQATITTHKVTGYDAN